MLIHCNHFQPCLYYKWAPSSEFVSSSIPSWQILTAHAQPFRGDRDLAFCLNVPLDSMLVWASSGGSGETAHMRRLAWTFAARIGDKYQIRLTQSKHVYVYAAYIVWQKISMKLTPTWQNQQNICVPTDTQISLGIRLVWSASSLSAWRKLGPLATHWAHNKDSDQTGLMPRLIWVFAGCTVILLVLSCCGTKFSFMYWCFGISWSVNSFEPRHEKTCFCHMRITKVQISLRIRAVWSAPLLFTALTL